MVLSLDPMYNMVPRNYLLFEKVPEFIFGLQIIWNSSTRAELLKFVEEQSAGLRQDGSCDLKDSHSFVYEAISKELYIGNVYLRVYNDQPDSEITESESFCLSLVDFISHLVHNAPVTKVDSQVNGDATPESSVEHPASDDSSTSVDERPTDREESDLIKNLQYGLISLQVQIGLFCLF